LQRPWMLPMLVQPLDWAETNYSDSVTPEATE
jgi:hypothetical protein